MTDYELITACISGDSGSFAELLSRYKNLVYSIVLRMVNDKEDANDLAQEVFIKAYRNLAKYQPEYAFSTWIMRIATNHVIDHRRKSRKTTVPLAEADHTYGTAESAESVVIEREKRHELHATLAKLPDIYRIPIVLYHQQGLSYQEIADMIEEPLSKVKNRIFRGRRMLKESLENIGKDGQYGLR